MSRFGREDDVRMLREVLETERLDSYSRDAFSDMLRGLVQNRQWSLTESQREWVKKFAEPQYENLVSNKIVSRVVNHRHKELAPCTSACPAWKPPALANLPKRPPGGRA